MVDDVSDYSIVIELEDYPTATFSRADRVTFNSTITYDDPSGAATACADHTSPTTMTGTTQPADITAAFDDVAVTYTWVPFTTSPAVCKAFLEITCTSIDGPGGDSYDLVCSDYTFDSDNELSLQFPLSRYSGGLTAAGTYTFNW
jgi:hypothetical protein